MLKKKMDVHRFSTSLIVFFLLALLVYPPLTNASSKSKERPVIIPDYDGFMHNVEIGMVGDFHLTTNIAVPIPRTKKPSAALIFLHGGGFVSGTKDRFNEKIARYAQKLDVVAVSGAYRLAPEHGFPVAIEDVKATIRFLKAHAEELNIDPDKIVVAGSSAGGYLAAMIAVTGNDDSFSKNDLYLEFDSSVRFAMAQAAPIGDFIKEYDNPPPVVERLFDGVNISIDEANKLVSPLSYLDKNDPPMLIAHGDADPRVPVEMSRDFVKQLVQLGIEHDYVEVQGGTHSLSRSKPTEARIVRNKLVAKIKEIAKE